LLFKQFLQALQYQPKPIKVHNNYHLVKRHCKNGANFAIHWGHVPSHSHSHYQKINAVWEQHDPKDKIAKEKAKLVDRWDEVILLIFGPHASVVQKDCGYLTQTREIRNTWCSIPSIDPCQAPDNHHDVMRREKFGGWVLIVDHESQLDPVLSDVSKINHLDADKSGIDSHK
jgi:hypothetical protein